MGAAMQLSAVTSYLTANIAAIPLLWVLPLGVYLLTLILAFQFPGLLSRGIVTRFLIVMLAGLGYAISKQDVEWPMRISIGFFLVEAFVSCLFCHSEAYRLRPQKASESTLFYLLFAAGGALGAFLVGIAFPLVFRFNYDLVLTCFLTALLALMVTWEDGWSSRLLWSVASVLLAVQICWIHIANERTTMVAVRNFYGSLRVKQDHSYPGATLRTLTNGSIQHGTQIFGTDELRKTPTTYYAEDSGIFRRCYSVASAYDGGFGALPQASGTGRDPCFSYFESACRPGATDRTASREGGDEGDAGFEPRGRSTGRIQRHLDTGERK